MANIVKRNVIYIDSTGSITVDAVKPMLYEIIITPSAQRSRFVLKESVGGSVVLDVKIDNTESRHIVLRGIELSKTFQVATMENVASVCMYGDWRPPTGR